MPPIFSETLQAITSLQSAHRLKGDVGIVAEDIIDTSGVGRLIYWCMKSHSFFGSK